MVSTSAGGNEYEAELTIHGYIKECSVPRESANILQDFLPPLCNIQTTLTAARLDHCQAESRSAPVRLPA